MKYKLLVKMISGDQYVSGVEELSPENIETLKDMMRFGPNDALNLFNITRGNDVILFNPHRIETVSAIPVD